MKNDDNVAPPTATVGATVRTIAVLEFVAGSSRPVSASEIARATELNPSTAFNITRTLVQAGYLQMMPGTRLYTSGSALHALAGKVAQQAQPHELARLTLQIVANRFDVVISLWRRVAKYSMGMLLAAENQAATRIQVAAGARMPLMHGSIGRLMALNSGLTARERQEIFAVVNFERPISFRRFMEQAQLATERGWSLDDGFIRSAVTSLSVPVLTGSETLEYVCTATMFRGQYAGADLQRLADAMRKAAERIAASCVPLTPGGSSVD
jgi:DNA-binding IclR family transcriptional regulator